MRQTSAQPRAGLSRAGVSRPGWVHAVNALTGTGGQDRKSPVELVANAASVFTRSSAIFWSAPMSSKTK